MFNGRAPAQRVCRRIGGGTLIHIMPCIALVLSAVGLHLLAGVALVDKVRAVCTQLGVDGAELTVPAALRACNEAVGIEPSGPLLMQTDALAEQLGLSFDAEPPPQPPEQLDEATDGRSPRAASTARARDDKPASSMRSLSVHDVMSATTMVHKFSEEVCTCYEGTASSSRAADGLP